MYTKHDYYDDEILQQFEDKNPNKSIVDPEEIVDGETFWRAQVDLAQEMDEDAKKLLLIKDLLNTAENCIEAVKDLKDFTLQDRQENNTLEELEIDHILDSIQEITSNEEENSFMDLAHRKGSYVAEYHDSDFYKKTKKEYENWINSNFLR
tara:strand:- start:857 stop:1309 length:453 start_codon:yes stop_codon:yes gene_type:complete